VILEANLQSLREATGPSPLLLYRTREAAEETQQYREVPI